MTDLSRFPAATLAGLATDALAELYELARVDFRAPGAAAVDRAFRARVREESRGGRLVVGPLSYSWNPHEGSVVRAAADLGAAAPRRKPGPELVVPLKPRKVRVRFRAAGDTSRTFRRSR